MECIVKDSFKFLDTPNASNLTLSEYKDRKLLARDDNGFDMRSGDNVLFTVDGSYIQRNGQLKYKNGRFEIHCFNQFLQKWVKYTWSDALDCYRREG